MPKISLRQRDEYVSRAFHTDEVWNNWKIDYDSLMTFRKNIKGKPDEGDAIILKMNRHFIDFYETVLWHSGASNCTCRACALKRQKAA